jgi:hypothetical protein
VLDGVDLALSAAVVRSDGVARIPYEMAADELLRFLETAQGDARTDDRLPVVNIVVALTLYGDPGPTGHAGVCRWLDAYPADIKRLVVMIVDDSTWPLDAQSLQTKLAGIYGAFADHAILPYFATPSTMEAAVAEGVVALLAAARRDRR